MRGRRRDDVGFTMLEVLVSIAIISLVMLALASFFVVTLRIQNDQGDQQLGVQAADDAMDRARALRASALLTGRDFASSQTQWQNPVSAVREYLASTALTMAYDPRAATGAGADAQLPTTYRALSLNGTTYRQYWYIGTCNRNPATNADCNPTSNSAHFSSYYVVIVAVTWPNRSCQGGLCSFVTATLLGSVTDDPLFNVGSS